MAVNKITHSWNEDYTGLVFTGSQRQPTPVEVHNYRADYDAQEQALQAQLDKLRDSVQDEPLSLPWVKELLASGQLAELDRPTVAAAIREIRVYEGNRIEIDYLLPEGCRALLEG